MIYLTRTALWGKMLPNFEIFICSPLNNKILMKDYKFINTKMICAYLYLKTRLLFLCSMATPSGSAVQKEHSESASAEKQQTVNRLEHLLHQNRWSNDTICFQKTPAHSVWQWWCWWWSGSVWLGLMSKIGAKPHSLWLISQICACVCVCARVVQTGTSVIFWLDTWNCCWSRDYNSVQRQKDREKDFIINIQESKMTFLKLELYWDLWNVFHVSHFKSDSL